MSLRTGMDRSVASPPGIWLRTRWCRLRRLAESHSYRLQGAFYPTLAVVGGLGAGTVLLAGVMFYTSCGVAGCPDVRGLVMWQPGEAPAVLDRNGERIGELAPYERTIVVIDSLPGHVPGAFLAVEDRRFHDHRGVDWIRVAGAALANLRSGSVTQGSSTISMQLARNVFPEELPGAERTFRRKFREVRVARLIERRFDKPDILEMYLNHIYFGGGAYGIEAAARLYFDKGAEELTVAEAATLAALPKAPAHYDPRRQPDRSRERRNLVLGLMERDGVVDAGIAREARESEIAVREDVALESTFAGYFLDTVRDLLEEEFGAQLYTSRIEIHTTLDRGMQEAAEEELEAQLRAHEQLTSPGDAILQGSVVFIDARTGAVRAFVGGRSSATTRYNRATLARRQLGSAFKPFVFAAAIQAGVPTSRLLSDVPLRVQLSRNDVWAPTNYDNRFEGDVSLREALVRSRNVPTVRLASSVGIPGVAQMARTAGLDAPMDETPSLALGTVATSPLQVVTAYSTLATLGHPATPHFVLRVEDEDGRVLWEPETPPASQTDVEPRQPVIDPRVAYIVTDMLADVVDRGTGFGVRSAGFHGPAAGKTGTTNDATDAWFIGYTPDVVGAVWIGYDRPASLGRMATGGGLAAPVWGRIMQRADPSGGSAAGWTAPNGVVRRDIDTSTGLLLSEGCSPRNSDLRTELFLAEHLPELSCPSRGVLNRLWTSIRGGAERVLSPRRAEPLQ
jgi:1A family penicillin-binding protein